MPALGTFTRTNPILLSRCSRLNHGGVVYRAFMDLYMVVFGVSRLFPLFGEQNSRIVLGWSDTEADLGKIAADVRLRR